jgi:hypothetical protein
MFYILVQLWVGGGGCHRVNCACTNIGKDLSRIPIPVNFSEPLSMLQRLTEDFEYRSGEDFTIMSLLLMKIEISKKSAIELDKINENSAELKRQS